MVGSPGQTVEHLIQDILFIEKLRPEMIGIGPFLPHQDTPFAIDNSSGYTDSRRTGTGDIGRSKCSHAQSVATGGTEKVCLI